MEIQLLNGFSPGSLEKITLNLGQPTAFRIEHDYPDRYLDEKEEFKEEIISEVRLDLVYKTEDISLETAAQVYQQLKDIYDKKNEWKKKEKWLEGIIHCLACGYNAHPDLGVLQISIGYEEREEFSLRPKLPFFLYTEKYFKVYPERKIASR